MLKGFLTEYAHLNQNQSDQQRQWHPHAYVGHIVAWDGDSNQVRVIDPLNSNEDANGNAVPMVSAWMPLATSFAAIANGQNPVNANVQQYGAQFAPFGGASELDIQGGEQVLVIKLNADIGHECCAFMLMNDMATPPGANIRIIGGQLQSGEFLYVNPSGTLVYFDVAGNIKVINQTVPGAGANTTGNIEVNAYGGIYLQAGTDGDAPQQPQQGDVDLQANQDINATAQRDINLTATTRDIVAQAGRDITEIATRDFNATGTRNMNLTAGVNRTDTVGGDLTETITGNETKTVGINQTTTVTGNQIDTVVGTKTTTVGGTDTENVGGPWALNATSTVAISAGGDINIASSGTVQVLGPIINIGVLTALFYPLLTQVFGEWVIAHTHTGVTTGTGVSGPPSVPPVLTYPNVTQATAAN